MKPSRPASGPEAWGGVKYENKNTWKTLLSCQNQLDGDFLAEALY